MASRNTRTIPDDEELADAPRTARRRAGEAPRRRTTPSASGRRSRTTAAQAPRRRSTGARIGRGIMLVLSLLTAAALIVTAYAGHLSPISHSALWGVLPLAFPICFWTALVLMLCQLLWHWRGVLVLAVAFIACGGPALDYFPLNFVKPKAPAGATTFKLLTYNVLSSSPRGEQMEYVLDTDADIVCLQEVQFPLTAPKSALTPAQIDSISARYPHMSYGGRTAQQLMMSKYPIEPIHLDVTKSNFAGGDVAAYRVTLPTGRRLTVFNVHMASMNISLREVSRDSVNRNHAERIVTKLARAARERAREINKIRQWLRQYGGPDVIICGDFNDVAGSYAMHSLADAGFHQTYPEVGLGPMVTYNEKRLYFCIDHALYRGDLRPLALKKGTLRASDHYPLLITFAVE